MRRTALIILAVAAGLTTLLLLAVAVAVATFDARTLVGPLQARVRNDTGRDLVIAGPVDLKLSLEPKLVAADVTLSNAPWGRAPQMLRAQRIELQAVRMKIVLANGGLDLALLHANGLGGTLHGRLAIDAARGASLHQWAASATGQATAIVGATTFVNARVDPGNLLDKLTRAVNPFRERDPSTELICAVVRLPLADGIAKIDRSIAIEAKKAGVSSSGTLDFREEKLDLTFRPKVRQGIPIDIPQIAELVRLAGPFAHPAISIDAAASAVSVAKIGAAIGTGGLSVLGTSIASGVLDSDDLCDAALGKKPAAKPGQPP